MCPQSPQLADGSIGAGHFLRAGGRAGLADDDFHPLRSDRMRQRHGLQVAHVDQIVRLGHLHVFKSLSETSAHLEHSDTFDEWFIGGRRFVLLRVEVSKYTDAFVLQGIYELTKVSSLHLDAANAEHHTYIGIAF